MIHDLPEIDIPPRPFTNEEILDGIRRAEIREQVQSRLRMPRRDADPPLDMKRLRAMSSKRLRRLDISFDCTGCGHRVRRVTRAWIRKRQDSVKVTGVPCPECGTRHWMEIDLRNAVETH